MTRTTPTVPTDTAASRYAANQTKARDALKAIEALLDAHAVKANHGQPTDWGFVGDVAHVADELEAVRAFLAGEEV